MTNTRTISALLMTLALVGSPLATAHAGGGGLGLGDNPIFFVCYFVLDGVAPERVLEINDQFIDPTLVRPGKLRILCTPADAVVTSGPDPQSLAFPDHLACYEVPRLGIPDSATVKVTDSFGDQTVTVGPSKIVCVGANKECLGGCPPPTNLPE